jgi:hypothetical protein
MILALLFTNAISSHDLAAAFPKNFLGSSNQKRIERFFQSCVLDKQLPLAQSEGKKLPLRQKNT